MPGSSFFGSAGSRLPNTSWKNISDPISSEGGFSGSPESSGFGAKDFLKAFASGIGADSQSKYRRQGEYGDFGTTFGGYGGKWSEGSGGRILENLGVVYPQQLSPVFLPGQEGKKSQWGQIGGALLGAASGFIPGVGLAGAALGSQLGGGLGGAL